MQSWPDGRIKLFLTQRLLQFRREHADLFPRGKYLPLDASGTFADCCDRLLRGELREAMDRRHCAAAFFARRFSADRRTLAGYAIELPKPCSLRMRA